jgi:hypothetical protein
MALKINWSARKHGIEDDDIKHAVNCAMGISDHENDLRLYLGPGRNADLIEVVVMREDRDEVAIHAMKMRPKYKHLLSGE